MRAQKAVSVGGDSLVGAILGTEPHAHALKLKASASERAQQGPRSEAI